MYTRIPRPCRNVESGTDVQTTTLAVLTFTEALQVMGWQGFRHIPYSELSINLCDLYN